MGRRRRSEAFAWRAYCPHGLFRCNYVIQALVSPHAKHLLQGRRWADCYQFIYEDTREPKWNEKYGSCNESLCSWKSCRGDSEQEMCRSTDRVSGGPRKNQACHRNTAFVGCEGSGGRDGELSTMYVLSVPSCKDKGMGAEKKPKKKKDSLQRQRQR